MRDYSSKDIVDTIIQTLRADFTTALVIKDKSNKELTKELKKKLKIT